MPATVSSLSLVRYRRNYYSVPTSFGYREVLVRGYVHEVVIACGTEIVARHPRSYEREDFVFKAMGAKREKRGNAAPGRKDPIPRSGLAALRAQCSGAAFAGARAAPHVTNMKA